MKNIDFDGYIQMKNPMTEEWVLIDLDTAQIVRRSKTKFKHVPVKED